MTEAICCRDLQRHLGEGSNRTLILKGVIFSASAGSVHAICGPSGCGKSTLLHLLGLLDVPDAGEIAVAGKSTRDLNETALTQLRNETIGFIFQFHYLMHEFSAEENVMMPMRRLGRLNMAAMRSRAGELLDHVGLADKRARLTNQLSGGEQQRVAIARALANDPKIILADEPTGNLDVANSEKVFELLTGLARRENKVLILATHNPSIAQRSDWLHEMRDGQIVKSLKIGQST